MACLSLASAQPLNSICRGPNKKRGYWEKRVGIRPRTTFGLKPELKLEELKTMKARLDNLNQPISAIPKMMTRADCRAPGVNGNDGLARIITGYSIRVRAAADEGKGPDTAVPETMSQGVSRRLGRSGYSRGHREHVCYPGCALQQRHVFWTAASPAVTLR